MILRRTSMVVSGGFVRVVIYFLLLILLRFIVGVHRFRVHPCPTDGRRGSGLP